MLLSWLKAHHLCLKGLFVLLILLNALDGILTIQWIESGIATEANPLMAVLIYTDPLLFMVTKMLLVSFGIYLLWQRRHSSLAVASLYICVLVYSLVMVQHLGTGMQL